MDMVTSLVGYEVLNLWPGAAPGTEHKVMVETQTEVNLPGAGKTLVKTNVNEPTITVVRPAPGKANGAAVVVLPGGGFGGLAWDLEGLEPARWLADRGITGFVLKYRVGHLDLAPGQAPPRDMDGMLRMMEPGRVLAVADATQALKLVRGMAGKYGIDPTRVGMMGFSAGAITTLGVVLQADAKARPNFAVSAYGMPVIDTQPAADAPPLFLVHAQDDSTVPAGGSVKLFQQWQAVGRPSELHIYAKGGHGFGMRLPSLPVGRWPEALGAWLKSEGFMEAKSEKATAP
ncbi:alpha/beta hydrolase [Piscinibacter gummiphilus]|uniref:Dienelactone hydrolase domain-containing protein n=1 Tax=Piscinibacter gummiphilus TaxID=946333 RepID=A0A1W6L5I7_9BURK|nr:alpha/beta hydrolase [Piscinibacter gummiphilus]ARN19591.1 hypothetical protein A4W93_06495 [Piscinibacter gummiphilus]GLS93459.1 endo-1,4-beta-xylanase [Piscinibacter gummiphilus]